MVGSGPDHDEEECPDPTNTARPSPTKPRPARTRGSQNPHPLLASNPHHRIRTNSERFHPTPPPQRQPTWQPQQRPRCNAACRTRMGLPCRSPAMANGRCRMHGGAATGPRSEAGRQRIRDARTTHGFHARRTPDPMEHIAKLILQRGELILQLASLEVPWPEWEAAFARLPPLPLHADYPDALRQRIEHWCHGIQSRWQAIQPKPQAPPTPEENTRGNTPCTVRTGPRLRPEDFRIDPKAEIAARDRRLARSGNTPCTVKKRRARPPIVIPPVLHFAPWSLPPPGDPWGISAWPAWVLGRGARVIPPPEIGPSRSAPPPDAARSFRARIEHPGPAGMRAPRSADSLGAARCFDI